MKAIKILILALILSVTACKKTNTIEPKVDRIEHTGKVDKWKKTRVVFGNHTYNQFTQYNELGIQNLVDSVKFGDIIVLGASCYQKDSIQLFINEVEVSKSVSNTNCLITYTVN